MDTVVALPGKLNWLMVLPRKVVPRQRRVPVQVRVGAAVANLDTAEMMRGTYRLTPEQEADYRAYAGDGGFRLSIGLDSPEDLIADLDQALSA
jgi:hypothetical protein